MSKKCPDSLSFFGSGRGWPGFALPGFTRPSYAKCDPYDGLFYLTDTPSVLPSAFALGALNLVTIGHQHGQPATLADRAGLGPNSRSR